jgi:broad specificity phosphatase PhoE
MADIRIETTEELRSRTRIACEKDGLTYEEMVEQFLDWRDEHREEWTRFLEHGGSSGRRGAGSEP